MEGFTKLLAGSMEPLRDSQTNGVATELLGAKPGGGSFDFHVLSEYAPRVDEMWHWLGVEVHDLVMDPTQADGDVPQALPFPFAVGDPVPRAKLTQFRLTRVECLLGQYKIGEDLWKPMEESVAVTLLKWTGAKQKPPCKVAFAVGTVTGADASSRSVTIEWTFQVKPNPRRPSASAPTVYYKGSIVRVIPT